MDTVLPVFGIIYLFIDLFIFNKGPFVFWDL